MKEPSIYGLVLAGGRSSRMGKDKGLIHYHDKPQREYLFELLGKFCDQVFTSCRKEQEIPLSLNPIHDKFEMESPLNGILSAFDVNGDVAWLVIAVDMPFVNDDVIRFLVSNRDRKRMATCFYDSTGKQPEPLLAIWEATAYPLLRKFQTQGNISPRAFLIAHDSKKLLFPDPRIHININTPEDRERLI